VALLGCLTRICIDPGLQTTIIIALGRFDGRYHVEVIRVALSVGFTQVILLIFVLEVVLPLDLNPYLVSVLTQRIEKQTYLIYYQENYSVIAIYTMAGYLVLLSMYKFAICRLDGVLRTSGGD
jgi:hypothetical protein